MHESFEQSIVSLLEEHVELAISTVQKLRAEKLELEAEIASLSSEVLQRDTKIQELEARNKELDEELELEKLVTSQERSEVRERLEGLMAVLEPSNEGAEASASADTGVEVDFTAQSNENEADAASSPVLDSAASGESQNN